MCHEWTVVWSCDAEERERDTDLSLRLRLLVTDRQMYNIDIQQRIGRAYVCVCVRVCISFEPRDQLKHF